MSDAVVLMAYGSPATAEDIRPYFEDIRGGRPVSDEAVAGLAQRYRRIGGRSPLDDVTEAQRAALERELGVPVFVGMKHWRPRIAEAVESALTGGATRILGLVLAPHYSRLSVGEYRERLEAAVAGRAELELVESWHDHEPFLDVLADRLRGTDAWVVFTAHSLPERIANRTARVYSPGSFRRPTLKYASGPITFTSEASAHTNFVFMSVSWRREAKSRKRESPAGWP